VAEGVSGYGGFFGAEVVADENRAERLSFPRSQSVRFWITKNSELSVHEQLVRQVILAILSEDLPAGHKLPSTRSIARRYQIHANTVSAAYHHLVEQGWLEFRKGSGLYVSSRHAPAADGAPLEQLLTDLLRAARTLGHEPDDVLQRLERMLRPRRTRIVVVEPDPAMREILLAEIGEHLAVPIETAELTALPGDDALIAVLPTRELLVRKHVTPGAHVFLLRLRSVRGSLEGQVRPVANAILTIVSRSSDFRQWARAILIAVGIEPDCLSEVDTALLGWQERACAGTLAIADVVSASLLPPSCQRRVFRVIADASLAELAQSCGATVTLP
jgi:DNA-binding transcriptional regulator YhcF (GntR family)